MMEWPKVRLGDALSLDYGKSLPARDRDEDGEFDVAGSNGPAGKHSEALVSGPGVVVGRKGSAGKVYWYATDFWPIDTTYYVSPRVPLDMRWVYYVLSSLHLDRLATTTGVPGLNRNDAYGVRIPLPPPSEQRRIVQILDQADRLRRLRAEADAKSECILPSLLVRALGTAVSWSNHPRSQPLGDLVGIVSGATPSKANSAYWNGVIPWISPKDMKRDFLADAEDHVSQAAVADTRLKLVQAGGVLIVVRGMILARDVPVALNLVPVTINQDMKAFVPKSEGLTGNVLWALLNVAKNLLRSLVTTAGHGTRKLDTPELMQFRVVVPRGEAARAIDSAVQAHKNLLVRRERGRKEISRLFAVLLNSALTEVLTVSWREAHSKELFQEMEEQAKALTSV